jgi:hypothetical protein
VAYSLKERTVESQQPAISRQRPINSRNGVFCVVRADGCARNNGIVMPPLSNKCSATDELCFLRSPCQNVISRATSH